MRLCLLVPRLNAAVTAVAAVVQCLPYLPSPSILTVLLLQKAGITHFWLPPPSQSVAHQVRVLVVSCSHGLVARMAWSSTLLVVVALRG